MTKPPRLGKGLSALLGDAAEAASHEAVRTLPVTALEPGPFQARGPMDGDALEELAASIRRHGVLQPILVRPRPQSPGRYEIIGGERRWRAAQAAHLHEVPVVVRDFDDREAMAAGLPVIASRSTAVPETVGDAAIVIDAESSHQVVQAIGGLRSGAAERSTWATRGQARAAEFTWPACVRRLATAMAAEQPSAGGLPT